MKTKQLFESFRKYLNESPYLTNKSIHKSDNSKKLRKKRIANIDSRKFFFHGTSEQNLRKILKTGLDPSQPPTAGGKETFEPGKSMKSYGGVYLTEDYLDASDYAAAASDSATGIIVVCLIEPKSKEVLTDEDVFYSKIDSHGKWFLPTLSDLSEYAGVNKYDYDWILNEKSLKKAISVITPGNPFIEEATDTIMAELSQISPYSGFGEWDKDDEGNSIKTKKTTKEGEIKYYASNFIMSYLLHLLEREYDYDFRSSVKNWNASFDNSNMRWDSEGINRLGPVGQLVRRPPTFPKPKALENTFDNLTKSVKLLDKYLAYDRRSIRFMDAIGYSGRNRIVLILSDQSYPDNVDVEFHYAASEKFKQFFLDFANDFWKDDSPFKNYLKKSPV